MERRVLIPGSFDPITAGHYDLALRAKELFDEVYLLVCVNGSKHGRFTVAQRLELLRAAFDGIPGFVTDSSEGLLCDYCRDHGIGTLVKGARGAVDFDYELSLSLINRSIGGIDTIILPTRAELMHVSSTMVSELIKYGKDFSQYVPRGTAELIAKYSAEARE